VWEGTFQSLTEQPEEEGGSLEGFRGLEARVERGVIVVFLILHVSSEIKLNRLSVFFRRIHSSCNFHPSIKALIPYRICFKTSIL
jgi:hypothetical protein